MELVKISVVLFVILPLLSAGMNYEPRLRIGNLKVALPKTPPKSRAIRHLYRNTELFAHRYDKRLRQLRHVPQKHSLRALKKFESDFNKDLTHLKRNLRAVNTIAPNQNPSIADATMYQLLQEFTRKLGLISIQTHCYIYGCNGMTPIVPQIPQTQYTLQPPSVQSPEAGMPQSEPPAESSEPSGQSETTESEY